MSEEIKIEDVPSLTTVPAYNSKNGKAVKIILMLLLVLLLGALGAGYVMFAKTNRTLMFQIKNLKQQTIANQTEIDALQKSIKEEDEIVKASKELSLQQAQLMKEWRTAQQGNLAKWQIAEAQYLVKLANDQVQFNHDLSVAILLLKRAEETLANLQDAQLLDIRKAIAANLSQLDAAPQKNMTNLYLRISGLDNQIDQLSLPIGALKPSVSPLYPQASTQTSSPWWQPGLQRAWLLLQQIVIVRKIGTDTLPLTFPEEKMFLYQNLHAQMENVLWALLRQNNVIYQSSLSRAIDWVTHYFVQNAPQTQAILTTLADLQKINIEPPALNLPETLKLFDDYLSSPATQGQSAQ